MFYLVRGVATVFFLVSVLTGCNGLHQKNHSTDIAPEIIEEQSESVYDNMAHLTVLTVPDARVRILNIKPKYADNVYLLKGKYHIEVSKPGFVTQKKWISLQNDEVMSVTLTQAVPEVISTDENTHKDQDTSAGVPGKEISPVKRDSAPRKPVDKKTEKKKPISSEIVKVENYLCSFLCVGNMNALRGEKQSISVTATDVWGAEAGVKQASKAVCKNFPFYATGEGSASMKLLKCEKSLLW